MISLEPKRMAFYYSFICYLEITVLMSLIMMQFYNEVLKILANRSSGFMKATVVITMSISSFGLLLIRWNYSINKNNTHKLYSFGCKIK